MKNLVVLALLAAILVAFFEGVQSEVRIERF